MQQQGQQQQQQEQQPGPQQQQQQQQQQQRQQQLEQEAIRQRFNGPERPHSTLELVEKARKTVEQFVDAPADKT